MLICRGIQKWYFPCLACAGTESFQFNKVNVMVAVTLAPCMARSSAPIISEKLVGHWSTTDEKVGGPMKTRYVDSTPTSSEVTLVTIWYIHLPNHRHTKINIMVMNG